MQHEIVLLGLGPVRKEQRQAVIPLKPSTHKAEVSRAEHSQGGGRIQLKFEAKTGERNNVSKRSNKRRKV